LASQITFLFLQILPNAYSSKEREIEIVLLVNGTSYAGVGWRPINLGPLCKSWPFIREALDENANT
jgi:hypothetical protein